jgi:hypothetical protein
MLGHTQFQVTLSLNDVLPVVITKIFQGTGFRYGADEKNDIASNTPAPILTRDNRYK